jgi:transmembrane sensor
MDRRPFDQVAEEAGFWDARLRSPQCTETDRARFAAWRDQDPAHCETFERLQSIAATLRHEAARADVRALRDAARRAGRPWNWQRRLAVAAVLAMLALGALVCIEQYALAPAMTMNKLWALAKGWAPGATSERYATQIGQRSTVALRDGSTIELDAQTQIRVAFTQAQRLIELTNGQAIFHVAKNVQRPFVVRAGDREILAIGTAFDVRRDAGSGSVRVTLIEGKVAVSREQQPLDSSTSVASHRAEAAALAARSHRAAAGPAAAQANRIPTTGPLRDGSALEHGAPIFLQPGEQLLANESSAETLVQSVDVQQVIGWREGRVMLEDLTLPEAVAEMNRHSPVQIRLQSPQLETLRVNGVFRAGEQEAFVAALESYFPIAVAHHGDTEIVLSARSGQ